MEAECPHCGSEYKRLGNHWQFNPSHRPQFSDYQKEVITGVLMGDGSLDRSGSNPYLQISVIKKEYLKYLDSIFGVLSTGVKISKTASESALQSRETGFSSNAKTKNYSDVFKLVTRHHPSLSNFDWYTDDGKCWPDNIELTPTVLKHWYVCDGCYANSNNANHINISVSNEYKNKNKIKSYFSKMNLPVPKFITLEREDGSIKCDLRFNNSESEELWDYMGDPIDGFNYKWPKKYRN